MILKEESRQIGSYLLLLPSAEALGYKYVIPSAFLDNSCFEFILLNDGSTDDSDSIVKSYMKKDDRIRYLHNSKNKGINFSRNYLVRESSHNIIAWIDSDDVISDNKLESQLGVMKECDADIVVSNYVFFKHGQSLLSKSLRSRIVSCDVETINKNKIFSGNENFCFASNMCKKEVLVDNLFRENITAGGDSVWVNDVLRHHSFHSDQNSVYYIRRHNQRISFKKRYESCISSGRNPENNPWIKSNNISIGGQI